MKQKLILCLALIGLICFNFIGCTNSNKNSTSKTEQQEDTSTGTDTTKTDSKSDTNKDTNSNVKTTENSETKNNDAKKTQESTKQTYKSKLDNIESGMKDLDEQKNTGVTANMISSATERQKRWDNALNEIYDVLKQQLSSDDMNKLKNDEIKWISDRDDKAKKDSLDYKGGSLYSYIYTSSLAETTKKRCYELVDKYMN